jgi:hypothetical protein
VYAVRTVPHKPQTGTVEAELKAYRIDFRRFYILKINRRGVSDQCHAPAALAMRKRVQNQAV